MNRRERGTAFVTLGIAALVVGSALLVSAATGFPHAGQPEYGNYIDRYESTSDTPVLDYANLSTEGKRAFQLALLNESGYAAIRKRSEKPPEFQYSDYAKPGAGMYLISYRGTEYQLTTLRGSTYSDWVPTAIGTLGGGLLVLSGGLLHRGALEHRAR